MSFDLPTTLTPSKISSFVNCPLAFRYSYLERLPEPSTIHQVRGTLLHRALQLLYSVGLDEGETDKLRRDATVLLERYFAIEDPTDVHAVGLEIDLRCNIEGVELRGIIDRLDHLDGDELAVVDYKTGRSPRPEQSRARLSGVQFYAFMCEQVFGRRPREIRLVYLRDRVVVVESPTEQSMRGQRQRMLAVWQAISRACEQGDFRPNPSRLCGSCNFRDRCPAVGGATEIARASR
jgi:putative RecB family exonuclease